MAKTPKPPPKNKLAELPKGLRRAIEQRKPTADSESLLTDLIDVWGGTRKLALDLHKEFTHAAAGGMTRQRILEMIQRLIVINTTHQIGTPLTPTDMTQDELESVLSKYIKKVSQDAPATGKPTT